MHSTDGPIHVLCRGKKLQAWASGTTHCWYPLDFRHRCELDRDAVLAATLVVAQGMLRFDARTQGDVGRVSQY